MVRETSQERGAEFKVLFDVDDYLYFQQEWLTEERTRAEVAAVVRMLDIRSSSRILDLACGFGRHANRLASMGCAVTGIDLMPGFIEMARRDAACLGVSVDYRDGDMRDIEFVAAFDRVLMLFGVFGYFSDAENLGLLARVAAALVPGGRLCIDTHNRDTHLKCFPPILLREKEGNLMIRSSSFDMITGRWANRRIMVRNGLTKVTSSSIRLYSATELREVLERVGLELEAAYGSWEGAPIGPGSSSMIVVARKPV